MFQIISQFRDEELEHLSTGLELDAEKVSAQTRLLTACESSTTTMITAKRTMTTTSTTTISAIHLIVPGFTYSKDGM